MRDRAATYMEPAKVIEMGIAMVCQELIQFEVMSVADNIFKSVKDDSKPTDLGAHKNYGPECGNVEGIFIIKKQNSIRIIS